MAGKLALMRPKPRAARATYNLMANLSRSMLRVCVCVSGGCSHVPEPVAASMAASSKGPSGERARPGEVSTTNE